MKISQGMMRNLLVAVIIATISTARADLPPTQLTWYGHSAFRLITPAGKVLLIDPWITNPSNPTGKQDLAGLTKADLILISHGHQDHVGNANEIARRTGARLVCTSDLGQSLVKYGGFPAGQADLSTMGNAGGSLSFWDGSLTVQFVPAVHGSNVTSDNGEIHYAGNPGGFVITIRNGPVVYHTGDTDLYSDMALISHYHKVDWMLACIGDHFTMGPESAAVAVGLVHPAVVIPMHFGTLPLLTGTPAQFGAALQRGHIASKLVVLPIGGTLAFDVRR